jgi:hypothetical protein
MRVSNKLAVFFDKHINKLSWIPILNTCALSVAQKRFKANDELGKTAQGRNILYQKLSDLNKSAKTAKKVNIAFMILTAPFILPLMLSIPTTVHTHKMAKNVKPRSFDEHLVLDGKHPILNSYHEIRNKFNSLYVTIYLLKDLIKRNENSILHGSKIQSELSKAHIEFYAETQKLKDFISNEISNLEKFESIFKSHKIVTEYKNTLSFLLAQLNEKNLENLEKSTKSHLYNPNF